MRDQPIVGIDDAPLTFDLGIDLFLLRFLDGFWRQQRLCFAIGGFLGEPQFPQARGVLGNERVALAISAMADFPSAAMRSRFSWAISLRERSSFAFLFKIYPLRLTRTPER